MSSDRDPVEAAAGSSRDLYGVATWEPRSAFDRAVTVLYTLLHVVARVGAVALSLSILASIGGVAAVADPQTAALALLSTVPAVGLTTYVWSTDVTTEPLHLLVGTFLLGAASAGLAAEINSGLKPYLAGYGLISSVLYYFLVVGPGEEAVKLLAVRLLPYGSDRFTTVLDGAVYGAMAGMGFAFIENAIYIRRSLAVPELEFGVSLLATGGAITTTRAIAGPGHVIYSAFAGYYLGLAKFSPGNRGPLVLKGILIAAALHGLYNATIGFGSAVVGAVTGLSGMGAFLVYVLLFDGLWGAVLFRKVARYRAVYNAVDAGSRGGGGDVSTEAAARSGFEFGTADGERER